MRVVALAGATPDPEAAAALDLRVGLCAEMRVELEYPVLADTVEHTRSLERAYLRALKLKAPAVPAAASHG